MLPIVATLKYTFREKNVKNILHEHDGAKEIINNFKVVLFLEETGLLGEEEIKGEYLK